MATTIVYEPAYQLPGWCDQGGLTMASWFDRYLASSFIALAILQVPFFDNLSMNTFFAPAPLTYESLPAFFDDPDTFFQPMSVRTLGPPDQAIKNEVRRRR